MITFKEKFIFFIACFLLLYLYLFLLYSFLLFCLKYNKVIIILILTQDPIHKMGIEEFR